MTRNLMVVFSLAALTMTVPAKAQTSPIETIKVLRCAQMGYGDLASALSKPVPLGIERRLWTQDVADALLEHVKSCRGR
jgi:hypothetical protein